jgi:hypothetical protein
MKVVVFGAGAQGRYCIENCPVDEEIVAVCDNNEKLWGDAVFGHKVISPEAIQTMEFDRVLIAIDEHSPKGVEYIAQIREQLLRWMRMENILLISRDHRNDFKVEYPRIEFLRDLSNDFRENGIAGAVAECGVCWGDYAVKINEFFPDKTLYLFDTFSSFDERDWMQETIGVRSALFHAKEVLSTANPDLVYLKMPHKSNVIIRQGYVPETFAGLDDARFCFVNLDMDLYAPTIASLRYFADKMVKGGVILVHDYYGLHDGIKRAVPEFAQERSFVKLPIGDTSSVAIMLT